MPCFKRLREMRKEQNLSQKEVADALGIPLQRYGRYERGVPRLLAYIVARLAKLYDTSTDYLLGLSDDPAPHR